MFKQMQSIAERMMLKLHDRHPNVLSEIKERINILQESKAEDLNICIHLLLKTACENNLLKELHDLLELNLLNNINQPLQFEEKETSSSKSKTLLELAAFNGHIEIVSYLVEVRLADDKVRPILENELERQKCDQNNPVIRIGGERKAKDFDTFCLEHAIEVYVKDKKAAFGYSSIEELYHALDTLSEEKWKYMRMVVSSQEPAPLSWKMGLILDQLPKMGKQSAAIGTMVALITYYETQSVLLSVTTGSLSAVLAWSYLTEAGYKQKINERLIREQRVHELKQHDRFFKAPSVFHIQQLDKDQHVDYKSGCVRETSYTI